MLPPFVKIMQSFILGPANIDDSGISLSAFPCRSNLKLQIIPVALKLVKVIINLESHEALIPF